MPRPWWTWAGALLGCGLTAWVALGSFRSAREARNALRRDHHLIWFHSGYGGGLGPPRGQAALTGPAKLQAVFDAIREAELVPLRQLHADVEGAAPPAPPVDLESLRAVHTDAYLLALLTGQPRALALSQKLPTWTPNVARGWLLNVGGLAAAARQALAGTPITANLGHGYHHAVPERGMGFCTLQGLAVVSRQLLREGRASRILIVDLDQHEGNGTGATLIGVPGVWNLTLYGHRHTGPPATANHRAIQIHHEAFPKGPQRDAHYLAAIAALVPPLLDELKPNLVLYQAGVDPHDAAGISGAALAQRDALVFAAARSRGIPVTWVLAGGYAPMPTLVSLHTATVEAANAVLEAVRPGMALRHDPALVNGWQVRGREVYFPDWSQGVTLRLTHAPALDAEGVAAFAERRRQRMEDDQRPTDLLQAAYAQRVR